MGKAGKKKKKVKYQARPGQSKPKRRSRVLPIAVAVAAVIGIGGVAAYLTLTPGSEQGLPQGAQQGLSATTKGNVSQATMDPANFANRYEGSLSVAGAYQAAKDIPEVIDELYCYCRCRENQGHKSLLACYLDEHAANCGVCLAQGLRAQELHDDGLDIKTIEQKIDQEFSKS